MVFQVSEWLRSIAQVLQNQEMFAKVLNIVQTVCDKRISSRTKENELSTEIDISYFKSPSKVTLDNQNTSTCPISYVENSMAACINNLGLDYTQRTT